MKKESKELLKVGDLIEFDFFGQTKRGYIATVGKYGYWIPYEAILIPHLKR